MCPSWGFCSGRHKDNIVRCDTILRTTGPCYVAQSPGSSPLFPRSIPSPCKSYSSFQRWRPLIAMSAHIYQTAWCHIPRNCNFHYVHLSVHQHIKCIWQVYTEFRGKSYIAKQYRKFMQKLPIWVKALKEFFKLSTVWCKRWWECCPLHFMYAWQHLSKHMPRC